MFQTKAILLFILISTCGCFSSHSGNGDPGLDENRDEITSETGGSPMLGGNSDSKIQSDCGDLDLLSFLANSTFCLGPFLEKEQVGNPLGAPLRRAGWAKSIEALNIPFSGDFSEYEEVFLLHPIGKGKGNRCFWLALMTRDFDGISKELLLISQGPDNGYSIELILAAKYGFAECRAEICSTIENDVAVLVKVEECYDNSLQVMVADTVGGIRLPIL